MRRWLEIGCPGGLRRNQRKGEGTEEQGRIVPRPFFQIRYQTNIFLYHRIASSGQTYRSIVRLRESTGVNIVRNQPQRRARGAWSERD